MRNNYFNSLYFAGYGSGGGGGVSTIKVSYRILSI